MINMANEANLTELKSQLSLTSHNLDDSIERNFHKKTSRPGKTLDDFEVVRGLGKGAFGRVFLIK